MVRPHPQRQWQSSWGGVTPPANAGWCMPLAVLSLSRCRPSGVRAGCIVGVVQTVPDFCSSGR